MNEPDDDVDHDDALLEFQLREIRLALDACQAGPEASPLSDRALSLQYQLEELCNEQLRQADRRMQRSVYQAMLADTAAIGSLVNEYANVELPIRRGQQGQTRNNGGVRLDQQDGYYEDQRIDAGGSTPLDEYVGMLKLDESHPPQTCEACLGDDIPYSQSVEVGACTHHWCRSCLTQAFELALQNEANYPVQCCKELSNILVDWPAVSKVLGSSFVSEFNNKIIEYRTDDRTYCHVPTCSAFINPDTIENRLAVCPSCQTSTCSTCKLAFHIQDQCQVARDAEFEEWKTENNASTCPRCGHTILISHGCNHMTFVFSLTDTAFSFLLTQVQNIY